MKTFLDYVQRHGFALFAWWRIIVGALGLIALALFGDTDPASVRVAATALDARPGYAL